VMQLSTASATLNDRISGRSNNSFNRSGISYNVIVNLPHDAVDCRPVNSSVRLLRFSCL
jgi:hypothetical protein